MHQYIYYLFNQFNFSNPTDSLSTVSNNHQIVLRDGDNTTYAETTSFLKIDIASSHKANQMLSRRTNWVVIDILRVQLSGIEPLLLLILRNSIDASSIVGSSSVQILNADSLEIVGDSNVGLLLVCLEQRPVAHKGVSKLSIIRYSLGRRGSIVFLLEPHSSEYLGSLTGLGLG